MLEVPVDDNSGVRAFYKNAMDDFLGTQDLWRKHIPRDGSCLFRAVSEQVFHTQKHHLTIRENCVDFLKKNEELFKSFVDIEFDQYLENLSNPNECAGHMDMGALSLMYKRDFLVFQEVGKPPVKVTDNRFPDMIMLCCSNNNHYDSVYPKSKLIDAAFCQSLVYGILYKRVFNLGDDVDLAVQRMLHDKSYSKQKRNSSLIKREVYKQTSPSSYISSEETDKEEAEFEGEIKKALVQGLPPFPYKVAKVLDPDIYRNVEYDLWNEIKKEQIRSEQLVIPDIIPGVKCLVRMEKNQFEMHAHVQEMMPNRGPVTVFIEELGEKKTVPYDTLQPIPVPIYKALAMEGTGRKRAVHVFDSYFRSVQFPVDKFKGKKKFSRKNLKDLPMFLPIVQSTSVIHLTHTPVVSPSTPMRTTYQKSHRQYLGKEIHSTPIKENMSKCLVPQQDVSPSPVNTSPLEIPYWNTLPNVFNMQQQNNGTLLNTSVSTGGNEVDSHINRQVISMEVNLSQKEDMDKLMDITNENCFYSSNKIVEIATTDTTTTVNCRDLDLSHPLLPFQPTEQSSFPYGTCPLCPCLVVPPSNTEQNSTVQDLSPLPSATDAYGIRYMYTLGNDVPVPYTGQQGPMVTVPPPIWTYNGNFTYVVSPSPYGLCDCSVVDNTGTVMSGQNPSALPYFMMFSPPPPLQAPSMMNNSGQTMT